MNDRRYNNHHVVSNTDQEIFHMYIFMFALLAVFWDAMKNIVLL